MNLERGRKDYVGGVGAIGNHLSNFANKIDIITYLGEHNDKQKFIFRIQQKY